jgi:hypothetical protein
MSEPYERDFDAMRLTQTATGDWMEPKGRNREAVYSFLFSLSGDEVFILATVESLDSSVVPDPIRWHIGLNHVRRRLDPNVVATLSDAQRSSVTQLMTEFGSSLNPHERSVEVVFDPLLDWR